MDDKASELELGECFRGGDEIFLLMSASKFRVSLVGVLASVVGNCLLP